jgi:hypothetical protein
VRTGRKAGRAGTYVLVGGDLFTAWCRVERCRVGERADGHAVLHIGHMWLRDDVERPRGVLMLVFVGGTGGVVGGWRRRLSSSSERGLLEGSKGRVEGTAERLGEGADVLGGGDSAECGHGCELDRDIEYWRGGGCT